MSWRYANVGKGMVSLKDHIVFVRLLQPEVDHNSQHGRHGDIVDHAYTCAHRIPPIEYEAQEDTFLLLSWCVLKAVSVPLLPHQTQRLARCHAACLGAPFVRRDPGV